jgi:hypothetical protein
MAEEQKSKRPTGRFARWRERLVVSWRRGGEIQRRAKADQRRSGGGQGGGFGGTDSSSFGGGAG